MSTFRKLLRRGNDVTRLSLTVLAALVGSLSFAGVASAQPAPGWSPRVSFGGTLSFADNSSVVGQADGASFSFGMKVDAGADYNHGQHEWRNALGLLASVTRTPLIDEFVKTSDNLNLDSTYLYHVVPWFGPFARVSANTSMFRGTDVRASPVTYHLTQLDGTVTTLPTPSTELTLSDPFRPLTFKESAGIFVQPYQTVPATVELRVGAGAQEVLADGQLAIAATQPPTGAGGVVTDVDLQELQSANQLGGEVAASVWGAFVDKKISYKLDADAMTPFAHSALPMGDTRSAFALTNVQLDARVSFHIVDWASLEYQLKAIRQPQIIDAFQVQNTLLLTFGLSYGGKPPPPPPCTPIPPPPSAPAQGAP
jgi:hypothetical protein